MLHRTSELNGFFAATSAVENGYEIWENLKSKRQLGRLRFS
jgi:hypothetical protein